MVKLDEFVSMQGEQKDSIKFKLAKVTSLNENKTAKITFYGEDQESQKGYSYLAGYEPKVDDAVLMLPIADTYIIIGKLLLAEDTPLDIIDIDQLDNVLKSYVTSSALTENLKSYALTYDLENYAAKDHTHIALLGPSTGQTAGLNINVGGYSHFIPSTSQMGIGYTGIYRWDEIYAITGTINTSDKRQKENINPISEKYIKLFKKLKPITYQLVDGKSGRYHIGFGAQDIEEAMTEIEMDSSEFAGFIKTPILNDNDEIIDYEYGLRYGEFISLNTQMIQIMLNTIETLEARLSKLELKEGEKA